ncbi:MAG: 7TM-DISM domain-containing protein [Candidatus Promineifilaceae bacterium]
MRRIIAFLPLLLLVTWWVQTSAQVTASSSLEPVVLTDDQDKYSLGLHLEILEDPSGEWTIEDVTSPEFDSRFVPSEAEAPNYGFSKSVYWVRLRLRSEAQQTERWLLDVGFANMHYVDLYTPLGESDGFEVRSTGSLRSPETRDFSNPRIVLNLTIPSQSDETIYLRFQNGGPTILPLTLWQPDRFADAALREQIVAGMFFGVVFGLLLYHLFLFFSLREATYLYLVLLLAAVAVYEASQASYLELYLIPSAYLAKEQIIALATALLMISIVLLHDSFLTAKKLFPNIYRMDRVLIGIWIALTPLAFFISYHDLAVIMSPMIVVTLAASSIALIAAWPRGFRANRALIIALLGLFASILLFILGRLGVITNVATTESLFRLGFVSLAVCWSLALADRVNRLKSLTEEANLELRSSEQRLAQILDGLPLAVAVYDRDQKPTYVNRRVSEILGNPAQGIVPGVSAGRTLEQAMKYYSFRITGSDQDYPVKKLPVYRALQGEAASVDDVEADLIDRRVPLEIWANPVLDDDGKVASAVVAFQDITARKQVEMALRASEKKFRVVVENNFEGIAFMDADREVLYVSPSYCRMSGFREEELLGRSGVSMVHPDDGPRVAQIFGELLQEPGSRISLEYRSRHQDGSWIWVATNAVNLLDDPRVGAVVLNIRNISEQKQAEAELSAYHEQLEHLVEIRTEELNDSNESLRHEIGERRKLEQLLYQHIKWLTMLNQIRQGISGKDDLSKIYEELSGSIAQLLDARFVFLLQWDKQSKLIYSVYQASPDGLVHAPQDLTALLGNELSLRKQVELGTTIQLSGDQILSLEPPFGEFVQDENADYLMLAPMIVDQSVSGAFGVLGSQMTQELSPVEVELVKTITQDLADLERDAKLQDQVRALVAVEERNRLARDLHDSVTQVLFSASLVAEVLPQIWLRDPQRALESVEELRRLTRGALAEMRTMLLELRPASVLKTPLPELLAQLTSAITGRIELPSKIFVQQIPTLPEDVHTSFYRIAQEALNNVVKHAQASQVIARLSVDPLPPGSDCAAREEIKLVIEDDGVGFAAQNERQEHLGLDIMRERAAAIQGNLSIISRPGAGTQVVLSWCHKSEDST